MCDRVTAPRIPRRRPCVRAGLAAGLAVLLAAAQQAAVAQSTAPSAQATAVAKPAAPAPLADLIAQFARSPDTIVAAVDGTPITSGMVADRLAEFPDKFAILPSPLVYRAALDDLTRQRALAVK